MLLRAYLIPVLGGIRPHGKSQPNSGWSSTSSSREAHCVPCSPYFGERHVLNFEERLVGLSLSSNAPKTSSPSAVPSLELSTCNPIPHARRLYKAICNASCLPGIILLLERYKSPLLCSYSLALDHRKERHNPPHKHTAKTYPSLITAYRPP